LSLNIKENEMTQFGEVQEKWDKMWKVIAAVALGLSVISSAALGINFLSVGEEEAIARTSNVPCYFEQGGAKFVASSGCEVEVQSGGTLDVQAGATFNSGGTLAVSGFFNTTPTTAISVTAGAIITPTGTLQPLTSFGAVTTSTSIPVYTSTFTAGDWVVLRNDNASDVIIIDGTGGSVECKADIALGAADTLILLLNDAGTAWNCLSNYDNS
jgi:hypothetical protein